MRKIPATMGTQHPDNANPPFWNPEDPFISVYQEVDEAMINFEQLGISECMWDWEGKHADAAIIDRLFSDHFDYFAEHQLGRDKFLTFRIPNIWEEKGYSLMQAMTAILSAEDFARDLKFSGRPLFEVILPMTERPEQLMRIHKLFQKLAQFKSEGFTKREPDNDDYLELIPLVESVESQHGVADLLRRYVELHQEHFGNRPKYIRTFLACSDPAIGAGHLATVLANKIAISDLYQFAQETDIPVFPIAGPGSLTFRGGLAPSTVDRYIAEFPGIRTVTVQSSFRYDHPKQEVQAAIDQLEKELPLGKAVLFSADSRRQLIQISDISQSYYQTTLNEIVSDLQPYFKAFPKRRDRRQHIGLLGYGRTMGEQKLPRAITFTGGFYSIGIPPEFIAIGRTLRDLDANQSELVQTNYRHLAEDLERAGRYFCQENLTKLIERNPAWQAVQDDVDAVQSSLGIALGPQTDQELQHCRLAVQSLDKTHKDDKATLTDLINHMARLRKSLG